MRLERALVDLAEAQVRTQQGLDLLGAQVGATTKNVDRLQVEMRAFKDEMGAFKDEMRAFKDETRREWGQLANKMGTLVEDIVAPGIPAVFRQVFGIQEIDFAAPRVQRRHRSVPGRVREWDYVAMAGDLVLVNETKSALKPEHIPEFLAALREFREYFPETEGRQLIGCLASFSVDPSLVTAGERQGLLMVGLGAGLLQVLNTPGFQPRRF
ncbi:MAG: hypothetical protein HY657_16035 [Acidobacteria bacterium]|nr:hypothetical protein [Acidobacteriota bacterium]